MRTTTCLSAHCEIVLVPIKSHPSSRALGNACCLHHGCCVASAEPTGYGVQAPAKYAVLHASVANYSFSLTVILTLHTNVTALQPTHPGPSSTPCAHHTIGNSLSLMRTTPPQLVHLVVLPVGPNQPYMTRAEIDELLGIAARHGRTRHMQRTIKSRQPPLHWGQ